MQPMLVPLLAAALFAHASAAAAAPIEHLEPPFWWTGMQHKGLQLMVHGAGVKHLEPRID